MNAIRACYCRLYQRVMYLAAMFLDFREPKVIEGNGAVQQIPTILKKIDKFHPLIVTDYGIVSLGLHKNLLEALDDEGIPYSLFDKVCPNPTFSVIEEASAIYQKEGCDSIIALGGGSSMDTAKAVGVKAIYPSKDLSKFKHVLSVRKKIPFLIAIPTTAGTGSEATVCAVIVNEKTKDKFSINDPALIPDVAVLDNSLLEGLPKKIISSTGMDTLTHAIESYIGKESTKKTKEYALRAIKLVKDNLYEFYLDPHNETARANMQKAAYLAGVSFTRAYVGYVHALAHALGGLYNVPHGYANAVLLPHVLVAYGKSAYSRLSEISDDLNLIDPLSDKKAKAEAVIDWINSLNSKMEIPAKFDNLIRNEADLERLSSHADKEANPLYPVPKELNKEELKQIYLESDKRSNF